jgi:hypothetical protein
MVMQTGQTNEQQAVKEHARVVAKAWLDPEFKDQLLSDPGRVLRECGLDLPIGSNVQVIDSPTTTIEAIDGVVYFGLPPAPSGGLGDEELTWPVRDPKSYRADSHTAHTTNTTASGPAQTTHTTGPNACGVAD